MEKALGEAKAKGAGANTRFTNAKMKAPKVKVRTRVVEEALLMAKNYALAIQEMVQAAEVLASKVVAKVVEAFRVREEYCLKVLGAKMDAFW